jgi:hypothetical protein
MGIMPRIKNGHRGGQGYIIYTPYCPSAFSDKVDGQGGHSVRLDIRGY